MMRKNKFILFTLSFLFLGTSSYSWGQSSVYTGYRVYLSNLTVVEEKDDRIKVSFKPINTGRQDLEFGNPKDVGQEQLVVTLDPKYKSTSLMGYESNITKALKGQDFKIQAGKIGSMMEMNVMTAVATLASNSEVKTKPIANTTPPPPPITTTVEPSKEKTNIIDTENCGDLVFEDISIKKHSKNTLVLNYTISNQGNRAVNIEGESRSNTSDNLGLKAYMARSEKLPKGALVLGGGFLKNRGSKHKGLLQPQESYSGTIKLDAFNITKFTPFVILELDAFGSVQECDETNNKIAIKVKE